MMRLYICAAAKDMAAERELLHSYVLPELNDRLAEHGIQVALDDPRSEEDYLSLSAADRAAEAFDRIDRARPWFVALVGDAVDDAPVALPADALARHSWLAEHQGASILELELIYGALEAPGGCKPLIYLRDDRFLRDVPLDQRGDYSSEDLAAVGRLETLKARLHESGVQVVDGYHCRWDVAAGQVNDLDELGKQLVEDIYDAIMQSEHPELQIGVLDELPASGAAMGMVGQVGEGALRSASSNDSADDDLNFDMEDILDVDEGLKESSSASAIEGVEPLDFLDDNGPVSPARLLEPTINYDAAEHADDVGFDLDDEVHDIDQLPVSEVNDEVLALEDIELIADDESDAPQALEIQDREMVEEAESLTDLSDMVEESPPIASPWADEMQPSDETPIPTALAAPLAATSNSDSPENIDDWLSDPVAETPPIPTAQPVTDSAGDLAEPELVGGDDEAFLAEPIVESLHSVEPNFDSTLAWSQRSAESQEMTDDSLDDMEEMEIDIVDEGTSQPTAADAKMFDDAPMAEPIARDLAADAIAAQAVASDDDDFAAFLEEPAADETVASASPTDQTDDAGWNFDDAETQTPGGEMFDDREQTIRHSSEATEISDAADEPMPAAAAEEDEIRLQQEEPAPLAPVAPVVASSYAPSPARKKKSLLPLILAALALLLLAGGAAGAYFAGLIPGLGGGNNVAATPPATSTNVDANGLVARINESNQTLTELFNTAKSPTGDIDGAKVQAAQALLAKLEADDPDVAAEEPIQALKARFNQLAAELETQSTAKIEAQRKADFRSALDLAGANAPASLDAGMLDEAKRLATTADERALIAQLEEQVAAEQARLAAAASGSQKEEAFAALAAATGDAEDYRAAIDAFLAAYPDDAAAAELKGAQETEPVTLDAVAALNKLTADWSELDMRKLPAADVQQQLDAANAALARTAALPGAAEVAQRAELLKPIAARTSVTPLAGAAINAPFVLSFSNGHRLYMTAAPAAKDGKRIATYVNDLSEDGTTAEQEVVPAEIDKANSGKSTLPDTAKAVNEALATAEAAWEPAFIKALMTVQADAKLDPVVKTQWLFVLATAGAQGSQPLAAALGDFTKLNESGVDASFNWADPSAAAAAREKCAAAIAALPQIRSLAPAIAKAYNGLASLSVPALAKPVGVLLKGADDAWTVQLADGAPQSASLVVITAEAADSPLASITIGSIEAGEAVLDGAADQTGWSQGRLIYAVTSAAAPTDSN